MNERKPLAAALQAIFGSTADQLAIELGVVRRRRIFSGGSLVRALVFGWLDQPDASPGRLAEMAARCGAVATPQALIRRFGPLLNRLLEALIRIALSQTVQSPPRLAGLLRRFSAVWIQDSSSLSLPAALADRWPGCGGNASPAALKVQVRWEIRRGTLRGSLEPGRSSDQTASVGLDDLTLGSLWMADLGYFKVARLAELDRRHVYFLSRIQVGTTVRDAQGRRIDLWSELEDFDGSTWERTVRLGGVKGLSCRLVALRCPEEVVAQRLKRLRLDATRHGRPISRRQRLSSIWTVLVTNTSPGLLKGDEMWTLYRVRWQIELLFKLWKQGNRVSRPQPGPPERMLSEVYAKLLGAIVQHWTLLCSGAEDDKRSMSKAARWFRHQATRLAGIVSQERWHRLRELLDDLRKELSRAVPINPRNKRPSTWQTLKGPENPVAKPS